MRPALSTRLFGALPSPSAVVDGLSQLDPGGVVIQAGLPRQLLFELYDLLREQTRIPVQAVMNYAPAPERPASHSPVDALGLCSPDREQRRAAVEATRETMRRAADLGCRLVVVALGEAPLDPRWDALVRSFARGEESGLWARKLDERRRVSAGVLDQARFALDPLLACAADLDLTLAIPNRARYYQVPNALELAALRADFAGAPLGTWLDAGAAHAAWTVQDTDPAEWLDLHGSALVGMAVADAAGPRRGLAPGLGELGYAALATRTYAPGRLVVVNMSDGFTQSEIATGCDRVERAYQEAAAAAEAAAAKAAAAKASDLRPQTSGPES